MRRLALIWSFAAGLCGQGVTSYFQELAAVPDGSALYFTTWAPATGTGEREAGRIYRVVASGIASGIERVVDIPATDGKSPDRYREVAGLGGPMLNASGHLAGWTTFRRCGGDISFFCPPDQSISTAGVLDGQSYGGDLSYAGYVAENSPEHRYVVRRRFRLRGGPLVEVARVGEPQNWTRCGEGYVVGENKVGDGGDCYFFPLANGGKSVAVTRYGSSSSEVFPLGGTARTIAPIPGTRDTAVLSEIDGRLGTRVTRIASSTEAVFSEIVLEKVGLHCMELRAARGGRLLLQCLGERPFWLWEDGRLTHLAARESQVLEWTFALDADAAWFIDGAHRIRRYRISTGNDEALTGPLVSLQFGRPLAAGALMEVRGTGFEAGVGLALNARRLLVEVRSATQIFARVPEDFPARGVFELELSPAREQRFDLSRKSGGAIESQRWTLLSDGRYGSWNAPQWLAAAEDFDALIGPERPAKPGETIHIYASGAVSGATRCWFGERVELQVWYAGPAPGLGGVQQISVSIPATGIGGWQWMRCDGPSDSDSGIGGVLVESPSAESRPSQASRRQ